MLAEQSWDQYKSLVFQNLQFQADKGWYVNVNTTPWEYHFDEDNYRKLDIVTILELEQLFQKMRFVKISRVLELNQVTQIPQFAVETFQMALKLLQ